MHFPGTPSPFRLSRRNPPTRRNAGPQFANSPRFLLSQTTPCRRSDDFDIVDDEGPASTAPAARTPAPSRNANPPRRQRDVIEDSDDGEVLRNTGIGISEANEPDEDDGIDSTPPIGPDTPGSLDAEYDALFAPVRDPNKRRRLSPRGQLSSDRKLSDQPEQIRSSSPEAPTDASGPFESPAPLPPPISQTQPQDVGMQDTPRMPVRPMGPTLSTPGSTKTLFRSKPRFMLSTKKPPSSQPVFRADTPSASQPPSPPTERRKPAFVLPRSPSPNAHAEEILAPFSPSSRTLHRRGRPRSGVPGYAPGGMAAEVRSWILETGSKRDQLVPRHTSVNTDPGSRERLEQYLVAARVVSARPALHSSSGPLAFIHAESVADSADGAGNVAVNILAMGPPRSKPQSRRASTTHGMSLLAGDLLGVHRGLAWDVEVPASRALSVVPGQGFGPPEDYNGDGPKERWIVAMEWDLLQETTGEV
ncbi:uncharacterized protein N7459_000457 [Penicillium hispanicum]|uniref:uncharacterized protein n=1 Tax=Penicillium hispanicum TaxID=1080232 RepID=UPI002541E5CD|nr:uncharacterized protein N7459_000457 [Penicillium hispanicum]KAJ5594249.1 hypothetical protein N7459_000457 [Penicillium hispanicum]